MKADYLLSLALELMFTWTVIEKNAREELPPNCEGPVRPDSFAAGKSCLRWTLHFPLIKLQSVYLSLAYLPSSVAPSHCASELKLARV